MKAQTLRVVVAMVPFEWFMQQMSMFRKWHCAFIGLNFQGEFVPIVVILMLASGEFY